MRNPQSQPPAAAPEASANRRPRPAETVADASLSAARAAHVGIEDFYVEDAVRCRRALSAPVPTVRLETASETRETAISLWGSSSGDTRVWRATSAEELSTLLGFESEKPKGPPSAEQPPPPAPSPELRERLHQLLRDMQAVRGMVLQPTVTLAYGGTEFVVRGKSGNERVRGGTLPHHQLDLAATVRHGETTTFWKRTVTAFGEVGLLQQLESSRDPLSDLRFVAEGTDAWPAPRGHFAVLWEPDALVSFLEPLLASVEADRFLAGGDSLPVFAERDRGTKLFFSLHDDGAPAETGGMDQEGNPSGTTLLVDGDGVRSLVTTSGLASLLGRAATGHGRRAGLEAVPTPVAWRPRVEGHERSASVAESLGNGICVRRCELLVDGANATVRVVDARLMHGGVVGERIESFSVSAPYVQLLSSLRAFGEKTFAVGRLRSKNGQSWITEWQVPLAASLRFPVPGSVPAEHYW